MKWLNDKLVGLTRVFGGNGLDAPDEVRRLRTEQVRAAMLDALGFEAPEFALIARRIRHAKDIQALWYLRGDLMAVLAAKEGETAAGLRVGAISALFEGMLPRGLGARLSPLQELERSSSSL